MTMDSQTPYQFQDLTRLFHPKSIAIVGASDREHSIGAHTMNNITGISTFEGTVYPINPSKDEIGGWRCYPDVASLPEAPDVMVVVIPAKGVLETVEQAAAKGVGFAVILTSGFSEADDWGREAEARIVEIGKQSGMRIYGPNCPGFVNINTRLGMTFSPAFKFDLLPGPIGLATQGGGLGRNMLQNMDRGVGVAAWSSSGNECDLQVADFIHHMANEPDIKVIGILIEGIKDGARFAAAVQHAAACGKPVVGLKVGRSEYGQKAAQSHTASITGSAEVNSAVFAQLGVVEVDDLDELIDVAWLFSRSLPSGREKLAVFASSGGAASLCADNVGTAGLELAEFDAETTRALSESLPAYAAIGNPIDTTSISISHPEVYRQSLEATANDPNVSLVLCPMPMDYGSYTAKTSGIMIEAAKASSALICPIWMSERQGDGYRALAEAGLTPFRSLRNMGKAVRRWIDWGKWRAAQNTAWTPLLAQAGAGDAAAETETLSEVEGKRRLAAAGVAAPVPETARTADEAAEIAARLGGPVAMKIVSPDITHKSDIGGVKLGIGAGEAAEAFAAIMDAVKANAPEAAIEGVLLEPMAPSGGVEAFVGVARDPVFGHMMTFGLGGIYVEMFKDVSRRMLPVTKEMVAGMIAELDSARLLTGYRGQPPRDVDALAELAARVSDFVAAHADSLEEMEINPVWVGKEGEGALALDAVIRLKR